MHQFLSPTYGIAHIGVFPEHVLLVSFAAAAYFVTIQHLR